MAALALLLPLFAGPAIAERFAPPDDVLLRNDLQLLGDSGAINIPLTTWPLAWNDIHIALAETHFESLPPDVRPAAERVWARASDNLDPRSSRLSVAAEVSEVPRRIRTFENTPREDASAAVRTSWLGERFSLRLQGTYVDEPSDGDRWRPDGTYLAANLGNWMLSAGWQARWWGPGRDASLILSTNARPMPAVAVQRRLSTQASSRWFSWIGPWTLTSFMGLLDDDRVVEDGLLWGFRFAFRPVKGLEIGFSRTAQWCGDGRQCDLGTFLRVLNGNDNKGANVDEEDEPGNQLAGIDLRWSLPKQIPMAIYLQWTAEDTRRTGAQLHQWMQQVGVEYRGRIGPLAHRTHLELSSTTGRLGALGEGSFLADKAYNHFIFETGYRYNGRSIGHGMDGDGLSWSVGTTLVDAGGNSWNASLRFMDINRAGAVDTRHSLSATPQERADAQVSHERMTRFGRFYAGIGYERIDDDLNGTHAEGVQAFLRWSLQ